MQWQPKRRPRKKSCIKSDKPECFRLLAKLWNIVYLFFKSNLILFLKCFGLPKISISINFKSCHFRNNLGTRLVLIPSRDQRPPSLYSYWQVPTPCNYSRLFFSNLSYQSLSFKIEFGAFVMVFTIAQGPRQLMPLFFGIKLVFKDLLNIQTRIFKQRYTIFLIWLRNEWTSGRAWVWWFVQQIDH